MSWKQHIVLSTAWLVTATTAGAQSFDAEASRAVEVLVEGTRPIAILTVQAPIFEDGGRVISFYSLPSSREMQTAPGVLPRRFIARRLEIGRSGVSVRWTSDDGCPTLRGVLAWMSDLPMPRLFVSGLDPRFSSREGGQPTSVPTHTENYSLWGMAFQPDGSMASVRVEGPRGPLGDWAQFAETNLEPCWTEPQPASG